MKWDLLFLGLLAFLPCSVFALQTETTACPKPVMPKVYMPSDAVRGSYKGEVILAVRFDDCGRVLEAKLQKRSRYQSINDMVLSRSKGMVLSEEQRANSVDGWYSSVISFEGQSMPENVKQKALDWPKTHSNPRYVLDDAPMGFDSVDLADKAIRESDENILRPPLYQFVHRTVQVDSEAGREFWLFIASQGIKKVAARYRPVIENGEALVKFGMLCDLEQSQCDAVRGLLLKGLPMAPAK